MINTGTGNELRVRRALLRLTQTAVAEGAGISRVSLSKIERGRMGCRPRTAARIRAAIDRLAGERG